MKNKFQSKSVPRGTRTIWRYLSAFILFFALSIGQMWGATETTPSSNGTNNADLVGVSYTIPGACNPKGTNAVGSYTGVKMRTNQTATVNGESVSKCWYMTINSGYKITDATFYLTYNSDAETIKNIYVDDALYSSPNEALNAKGGTPKEFTISEVNATKQIVFEGTNEKQIFLYAVFTYEATGGETPKSSAKKLLSLKFDNGFDAFINESDHTVTAYYLNGADAPSIASHTESDKASYAISGNTITITAEDETTQEYALTLTAVEPYAGTGDAETFNGEETYVKSGAAYDSGWRFQKNADDGRIQEGRTRLYFFVDACQTLKLKSSANSRNMFVYRNGVKLDAPTASGSSGSWIEIAGSEEPAIYGLVSNQTGGDAKFNQIQIVPVPTPCTPADATFAADADEIEIAYGDNDASTNLTFTKGSNTSDATFAVTKDDEATTDASVSEGVFTASAAGTYKVTATQAADGIYCEVVKEVTITVTEEAAPVVDCSSLSGTIYKFQIKTSGLTNGNLSESGTFDITTSNYLASISGGTLKGYNENNKMTVQGNSSLQLSDNSKSYFIAELDCALQAGDTIKSIVTGNTALVSKASSKTEDVKLQTSANATTYNKVVIPTTNNIVGETKVYIWKGGGNCQMRYFEVIRPVKYAVTYNAGTGSVKEGKSLPTQDDAIAGEKFNLASGENLEKSGYDFIGWKANGTGDLLKAGDEYTMGNAAVEFVAQWDVHVAKYGVKFMDGDEKLDSLSVTLGQAPVFANPTKALYSFAGWKDGDNNDVTLSSLATSVTAEDTELVLYAQWTKAYAADGTVNFADDNNSGALADFLPAGYTCGNLDGSKNSVWGEESEGDSYFGYKLRHSGAYVELRVVANKRVTFTFGNYAQAGTIKVGDAAAETCTLTDSKYVVDTDAEAVIRFTTTSDGTVTLKSIIIGDIPAKSDDATLSDLKVGGTTVDGFAANKFDYYVELPYGSTSQPEVTATKNHAKASAVVSQTLASLDDAVVTVTAEDLSYKTYTVHFTVAPKLGVKLINVEVPAGTHDDTDATGYFGGTGDTKNEGNSLKIGDNCYAGVVLPTGKTFQAGDVIDIHTSVVSTSGGSVIKIYADKSASTLLYNTENIGGSTAGHNYFVLPEAVNNQSSLYVVRTSDNKWNGSIDYIAVYREMPSFFESFTVAGVAATIDETVSPKTITVEVPAVTEITALTPTYKAWANGGATVSPTTAQDFSIGAVDYTVTSAYEETTTYKVTVTKAAAIKEVVISGTLSVKEDETTALSAVVYDTNDHEAAIQDVTWTVKSGDEDLASVDANGVVTGKNAGTAHIIATSVADGDISAQVAVEVTENLCRTWTNPTAVNEVRTLGKMKVTPESISELKEDAIPYQGASATKAWKLDARDTRYAEVNFTDNAQFESLTIGVTSNGSSKNYQFAVAFSTKAGNKFAEGFISAAAYEANDKDEAESLVDVVIPTGTKVVRILRQYRDGSTDIGGSSSVYLYYINACKKELVALTSVAVADKSLAVGVVGVPAVTLTPATADVASYAWEIVSDATGAATINAATGAISSTATGAVTVKVTATDELSHVVESNIATINIVNKYDAVIPVTGTTTWSWDALDLTGYAADGPTIADPDTVLANYFSGIEWQQLAGSVGGRPYRNTTDYKCYQGYTLYFETTVPGKLKMYASRISNQQKVYVNGIEVGEFTGSGKIYLNEIVVPAGPVYITAGTNGMRIYNMTFDTNLDPTQAEESFLEGYERDVTAGRYGTICLPNGGVMVGAAIFEIAYFDIPSSKIYFDEVLNGTMEAGMPYIFLPNENVSRLGVYYTDAANAAAGNNNGLYGSYDQVALDTDGSNYILLNNQYCRVVNDNTYVGANRAYIKLTQVPDYPTAAPAPGRRRISMGVQGTQVATGIDAINASEQPMKIMIDGQMYILRGEKMYDATGRLVK